MITKQEFEDLLDKLLPANEVMRDVRISLPCRLDSAAKYLFLDPACGSPDEREQVREQLHNLEYSGHFLFAPEDKKQND